jgi:hypothetical protein
MPSEEEYQCERENWTVRVFVKPKEYPMQMATIPLTVEAGEVWAVFEWAQTHDGPVPVRKVKLNRRRLTQLPHVIDGVTHSYQDSIDEP